jgi:hypothetical protein
MNRCPFMGGYLSRRVLGATASRAHANDVGKKRRRSMRMERHRSFFSARFSEGGLESKTERGGNTVEETIGTKEQETDAGLTTADLANAGERLKVRIEPAQGFHVSSSSTTGAGAATAPALEEQAAPLFSAEEAKDFRGRWDAVQVGFVDEPRRAVVQADSLVAAAMKRLAEMFAAERSKLESQWDRGDDVSTEDLRLALRRYRSFFGRLLSV